MKVTYIVSNIDYALEFDWIAHSLANQNFQIQFIFINQKPGSLHQKLLKSGISSTEFLYNSKKQLPLLTFKVRKTLKQFQTECVHAHLFEGSLVGLLAAKLAGIRYRIYTRHHSNYHHVYAPGAVKFDRLINKWSTHIVSISDVVTKVLTEYEHVPPSKITLIEHGINPANFRKSLPAEIQNMKAFHTISEKSPVIGCISRLDKWKGVNYILEAFSGLLKSKPNAVLLLAYGGGGDDKESVFELIRSLHIEPNIRLIPFEKNINTLYDCMDLFVHTPIDHLSEAFGQIYIEAMYKKIPIIATKSGVGNTLINQPENRVEFQNTRDILDKMMLHLSMDETQRNKLLEFNFNAVKTHYIFERKEKELINLYKQLT